MIQQASAGISGLVGGLVAAYDLRLCFVLTALNCFAGAAVILTGREPPSGEPTTPDHLGYWATLVSGARIAIGAPHVRYVILIGATVQLFTILLTMTVFQLYTNEMALPIWSFGSIVLGIQVCSITGSYLSLRITNSLGRERLLVLAVLAFAGLQVCCG